MNRARRTWIPTLLLASFVALGTVASGCVVHARAQPTYDPPEPRYVEVDYRPGYVWVQGRWLWQHGNWNWSEGHWVRERSGHYYTQGYWTTRGTRRVWVTGNWSRGTRPAGVRTRDHRYRGKKNNKGNWGPKTRTRDHRRGNSGGNWGPGNSRKPKRNSGGTWGPGTKKRSSKPGYRKPSRVKTNDHRKSKKYKKPAKKKKRVKTRDHRDN